jgi:hypothetical protein
VQLTDGLVGGNAGSWRNQGPDPALPPTNCWKRRLS